ncbi:lysylphosphatidylglycerol synthase transmembrane domain-containing protein [Aurantimonas sp. C2-6-R+9]|nr:MULTISPECIES: lysylphosphatidylglycerol synthase transmembrane domain-containing protein [unclassified Aurantimonas]MEC5322936.1 lysylphosphatidylglycerol synthase transmembrane domain-containing protein [Aurantimonas sp. A3-2-R12]MEC5380785.1 lysylphosphatidylglycerol synthase transmembrane domain-containing protein [Aurantimonas sp. C2-6-R+9]MEC5410421.1 lysylphosphatidylglycerol synthase transmembrane domain-containing protein [Aurantimonas sp. C2-4-R8]
MTTDNGPGIFFRWVLPAIGAAVALATLFWLYRGLDVGRFLSAIATAHMGWLVMLVATILLEQLTRGWKWRQILFDLKPISSVRLFGAIMAGYGVAIVVPLGISPLVRSWLIARLEGLRMASVLMTSAIERFLDGIVFALLAAFVALAVRIPDVDGDVRTGLAVAGGLNLLLFSGLLYLLFIGRSPLGRENARVSRCVDWLAARGRGRLDGLRQAIRDGIVWPRDRNRQIGAVLASVVMKFIAATHFLWAGLAVGIVLAPLDYLFLMIFAGFALVLARFVRVPGGFVIGSGFALKLLGVPDEQALAMILFNHVLTIALMVVIGLWFLWRSGIDIRQAREAESKVEEIVSCAPVVDNDKLRPVL